MNAPARDVTVKDMMDAREKRAQKQKMLVEKYHFPVISFSMNIPGPRKVSDVLYEVYMEGCRRINEILEGDGCRCEVELYVSAVTGFEYYASVQLEEKELKKKMIEIEEQDTVSRLFDIDVIGLNNQILSREQLGYSKRKCLLCGNDAHECSRNRTHSVEDLTHYIQKITSEFCMEE